MLLRSLTAPLALCALILLAPSAGAATRVERVTKTAIDQVSFGGFGCKTRSTRTVNLPKRATSVKTIFPDIGADLYTAGNTDAIATIDSLDSGPKSVSWVAIGTGSTCLPENDAVSWSTAIVVLKVGYIIRERVLTRRTVIARGDAICRRALRDAGGIRSVRDPSAYATVARIARKMNRKLGALKVSKDRRYAFVRFRAQISRAQRAIDRAAAAIRSQDAAAATRAQKDILSAAVAARSAARSYGFRTCPVYAFG